MTHTDTAKKNKAVAYWLLVGVFMIIVQVILGGVTRLTGSGLSMTEWNPIMGAIPPLNTEDWEKAFAGYQEIAQYKFVNNHFTLSDFKFIYYWEWFHRQWARLLGVVFIIPFVYFLVKKYFSKAMIAPLLMLFALGGLQGFIGWFMVQSGLGDSELKFVDHIRLSIHFIAALILLSYTLWFALKLLIPKEKLVHDSSTRNFFLVILGFLIIQLFYGAFMAGLHAALAAPTWPKMNGSWIPPKMFNYSWISNAVNVQFLHRLLAYVVFSLVFFGFFSTWNAAKKNNSQLLKKAGYWPFILVSLQVVLGVVTVISAPYMTLGKFGLYEILAESHQIVGMGLLISIVLILFLVRGDKKSAA